MLFFILIPDFRRPEKNILYCCSAIVCSLASGMFPIYICSDLGAQCCPYVVPMLFLRWYCVVYVLCLVLLLCCSCDSPMVFFCCSSVVVVLCLCRYCDLFPYVAFYVVSMLFRCCSGVAPMMFVRCSCGVPMVFLCWSYDVIVMFGVLLVCCFIVLLSCFHLWLLCFLVLYMLFPSCAKALIVMCS